MKTDLETKFDVVIVSLVLLGNEAGYYLAHRHRATLVLYASLQQSLPVMNTALGQPHNPSIVPAFLGSFS